MANKIILSADSTCDLSPELKERYQVQYFPYHILLDGQQYMDGVQNVLRLLKVLPGDVKENPDAVMVDHMTGLNAEQEGCWYPCVKINDQVQEGQKLGEIRDYFGNVLGEYFAPCAGVMLYVISSLPINVGDPIIAIG